MIGVRPRRPAVLGELLVVLLLVFAYDHVRQVATLRAELALSNARLLLHWEAAGRVDVESALNSALARHHMLQLWAACYYQMAHLSATLVVLLWCYWRRPALYRGARNALLLINTVGLAAFWLFPVAPPRLVPGAGFVDSAVVSGVAERTTTLSPDLYAAMPSLHVAWATWVAVVLLRTTSTRTVRAVGIAHLVLTSAVVVATANHYVLDVVAGGLIASAALRLTIARRSPNKESSYSPSQHETRPVLEEDHVR